VKKQERKRKAKERFERFITSINADFLAKNTSEEAHQFAFDRLKVRFRKKLAMNCKALESDAYNEFVRINDLVSKQNKVVFSGSPLIEEMRDFIRNLLERTIKSIDPTALQECFSQSFVLSNWQFGPGSSNGIPGAGAAQKIDKQMTCTQSIEPLVRLLRVTDPYFRAKDALSKDDGVARVSGSRLKAVPKNEESVRIIAIEPSGNMALQLGAGYLIELALRRIGLDIRYQQEKNRDLARRFSIDGQGCTLDLSKASDMFSINLIRDTWPEDFFAFFMKARCPQTTLPDGRVVDLSMMSTMGNGFTFPMMTLTLVSLVYAVRRLRGGPRRFIDLRDTAVFGDDIIVPKRDFDDVCAALQFCGLIVNYDKSYADGPFRESCGGDYWNGVDVTPFYIKSLSTVCDLYVAINQVLRWSADHDIFMANTLACLFKELGGKVFLVPQWMSDVQGIRTVGVPCRYKHLQQVPVEVAYQGYFVMPLILGGYLKQGTDGRLMYTPRDCVYCDAELQTPSRLSGWMGP